MAGTDKTRNQVLGPAPIAVLVNPQLGENIGTAARAMANFGLHEMRLFDPRDGWPNEKALATSSGAHWILDRATVHWTLEETLSGVNYVYATTARPRGMVKEVITPEQAGADMRGRVARGETVAILFGRERTGLSNDEISLADVIVTAPVNPAFASINIAQAVLLMGYEWYKGLATTLGEKTPELPALQGPGLAMPDTRPATKEELYGFFGHLERELDVAGFFKTDDKKPGMMRNIRNLFGRAELTEQEVRSLRGIVSSLTRAHEKPKEPRGTERGDG
ncbi:RNA methyltransferase [Aestuariivirga sp.]|uniref:RNA methyltransferase n=1 Tax=Aestuariivirga sp. TaxID=2650926 RepID=UPI0025BF04F3|nr:RNA methyltransferase [Aestuariivirga sp.]MCA3555567.1 RNA methyltransferase [Aestuariivirga sp.]